MASKGGSRVEELTRKARSSGESVAWPSWARLTVSMVILFHLSALTAGVLRVPPSSLLEQGVAEPFTPYFDLVDLGYSYRYYAEPPPTPVVTATLEFGEGRPSETFRLPGLHVTGPRLRHQRELALANALFMDVQDAKRQTGDSSRSRVARAYARHLCLTRPGCQRVTVRLQHHLIPEMETVAESTRAPGAERFDLFDESLFTTPELIGEYSCDAF